MNPYFPGHYPLKEGGEYVKGDCTVRVKPKERGFFESI